MFSSRPRKVLLSLSLLVSAFAVSFSTPALSVVLFEHLGAIDPATEGWTPEGNFSGVATGPLIDDAGSGFDAWMVDDNSLTGSGYYDAIPTPAEIVDAATLGWTLSARLRTVQIPDPDPSQQTRPLAEDGSPGVVYRDGTRSWHLTFGTESNGDLTVCLQTVSTPGSRVCSAISIPGGAFDYHLYSLVFDPSDGLADLFIDGALAFTDYGGSSLAETRVSFGGRGTPALGQANFNLVRFEINRTAVPEPTTLALMGLGLAGIGYKRRQSKKA